MLRLKFITTAHRIILVTFEKTHTRTLACTYTHTHRECMSVLWLHNQEGSRGAAEPRGRLSTMW